MKTTDPIKSKNYSEVEVLEEPSILTGDERFDNFFSKNGGMVLKSVILLTGSSGAGKTTMAVNLQKTLNSYRTSLYSREMSASSVKEQTIKLKIDHKNAFICDHSTCLTFNDYMNELDVIKPKIVVVDSLQVIAREDFANMSEEDAAYSIIGTLRRWAEENTAVIIIIGHVTKDNEFRGANTIMQMVDAHLEMIHHKNGDYRTIAWGQKNRKGPLAKLCYSIDDGGIRFFPEEELKASSDKKDFVEYIAEHALGYLKTIDRKHENFEKFKKEYNSELKIISEQVGDDTDKYIGMSVSLMATLLRKYDM
jgi:predicted ATP-dependent serine protease